MAENDPSSARFEELRQRWAQDPGSRIFMQLAEEYRRRRQPQQAIEVLTEGLKHHPGSLSAQVALGRCRLEAGLLEPALAALEAVVRKDPTQMVAYRLLVEAYLRAGDTAQARERLELYRQLNSQDPDIDELEARIGAVASESAAVPPPPAPPAEEPPTVELPPTGEFSSFLERTMGAAAGTAPSSAPPPAAAPATAAAPSVPLPATPAAESPADPPPAAARLPSSPPGSRQVAPAARAAAAPPAPPEPSSSPADARPAGSPLFPVAPSSLTAPDLRGLRPRPLGRQRAVAPEGAAAGPRSEMAKAPAPRLDAPSSPSVEQPPAPPTAVVPPPDPVPSEPPRGAPPPGPVTSPPAPPVDPLAARLAEPPAAAAPSPAPPPSPPDEPSPAPSAAASPETVRLDAETLRAHLEQAESGRPDDRAPLAGPGAPSPAAAASAAGPLPPVPEAPAPPATDPATATLGGLYLDQGHAKEAEVIFRQVLNTDPENPTAREGLSAAQTEAPGPVDVSDLLGDYSPAPDSGLSEKKAVVLRNYLSRLSEGSKDVS